jgi:hypothetical protein
MEILISVSLFSIISLIAFNIFMNIARIQGRLALENAIYEDARFMMERMSRSIRSNTIDYEEYFNKAVSPDHQYGDFFGCYAAQFYNPGTGTATDLYKYPGGELGAFCNDGKPYYGQDGCVVYKPSIDLNTGEYPYKGAPALTGLPLSNAFCPVYVFGASGCTVQNDNETKELYLINRDGNMKTIFGLKKVDLVIPQNALAMVEKLGEDRNDDGVTESWKDCQSGTNPFCCAKDFTCNTVVSLEDSLTSGEVYNGFIPISPLRTNVTHLSFRISPGDDPHKAFAEAGTLSQPKVVVTLEAKPSDAELEKIGMDASSFPPVVLQTTISPRVQSEVKSYIGANTYSITGSGATFTTCKTAN